MPTASQWSTAFARQASADLATYRVLCLEPSVPRCHRLQFLQMACEKVAKSHLCAAGSDPGQIQSSHAYVAKVMPIVIREQIGLLGAGDAQRLRWVADSLRPLMREIELLSPSVDDGGNRPNNCEYPWIDPSDRIRIPADDLFPGLNALNGRIGILFLKLLRAAVGRLAQ